MAARSPNSRTARWPERSGGSIRVTPVILVDGAPAVLPVYGGKLSRKAAERLEKLGVEIQLNAMVTNVDVNGFRQGQGRQRDADRGPVQGVVGRRAGQSAGPTAGSRRARRSIGPVASTSIRT